MKTILITGSSSGFGPETVSVGGYFLTWPADRLSTPAMTDFANWVRKTSSESQFQTR